MSGRALAAVYGFSVDARCELRFVAGDFFMAVKIMMSIYCKTTAVLPSEPERADREQGTIERKTIA
eukprot:1826085-Amphidinium_carterae.1